MISGESERGERLKLPFGALILTGTVIFVQILASVKLKIAGKSKAEKYISASKSTNDDKMREIKCRGANDIIPQQCTQYEQLKFVHAIERFELSGMYSRQQA